MARATGPFRREHRLLRPREFRNVLQRGRRTTARVFVVFLLPADPANHPADRSGRNAADRRLGITVSRKVGNSVARNHVKRRVREWFRRSRGQLPPGSDLVVIGRRGAAQLSGTEMAASLDDAVHHSGSSAS